MVRNFLNNLFKKKNFFIYKYENLLLNKLINKLFVYDCGHELIRIGGNKDGGYLVPNILDKIKYCFSPGVGDVNLLGDVSSFENDLSNRGIKCFLADNTVVNHSKHDFEKKNLNVFNDEKNFTLENWIKLKLGNNIEDNLILQMDIEGSEIGVIYNTSEEYLKKFKILVIEFHDFHFLGNLFGIRILDEVFSKLLKNFSICHIHPNNCCGKTNLNNMTIPSIMEITFINNEEVQYKKLVKHTFPHKLDVKNVIKKKDIILPEIFYKK
ncbi:MAG: hypothetical protein CBC24_00565 [Candidatus Pelagibacter sp. TMED64]|nr:hypothetical protein [Candidatus Pelagibacter sp.]OUU67724.1 MAG: hypothetical protein CBC24_00565 [Candidatus Pelagibacter sp. TMED64]|tara:strand:+ start:4937 stop:5737 length:801 start_codon:yes stop_codon:yes gene_type:complete